MVYIITNLNNKDALLVDRFICYSSNDHGLDSIYHNSSCWLQIMKELLYHHFLFLNEKTNMV